MEEPHLNITSEDNEYYQILFCDGDIDAYTGPILRQTLDQLVFSGKRKIIVDLTNVKYIDSTGMKILLDYQIREKQIGGEVAIIVPENSTTFRLFKILQVQNLFRFFPDLPSIQSNHFLNTP